MASILAPVPISGRQGIKIFNDQNVDNIFVENTARNKRGFGLPLIASSSAPTNFQQIGWMAYDQTNNAPVFSNGINWQDLGTGSVSLINTGTGLTGGPITTSGTISIANTSVAPGTYTYATVTVNQQGQITNAVSGTAPVTTVTGGTGINIGGTATQPTVNLSNTTVAPASYILTSLTVNAQGQITSASSGTITTDSSLTGAGTVASPLGLATQAGVAGTFTNASFVINNRGVVTGVTSGSGTVTTDGVSVFNSGTNASPLALHNFAIAGTYNQTLTFNNFGLLTSTSSTENAYFVGWNQSITGTGFPNGGFSAITATSLGATVPAKTTPTTSSFVVSTGVYTCGTTGTYHMDVSGIFSLDSTGTNRGVRILRNGNEIAGSLVSPNSVNNPRAACSLSSAMNSGDTISFQGFNDATQGVAVQFFSSVAFLAT